MVDSRVRRTITDESEAERKRITHIIRLWSLSNLHTTNASVDGGGGDGGDDDGDGKM